MWKEHQPRSGSDLRSTFSYLHGLSLPLTSLSLTTTPVPQGHLVSTGRVLEMLHPRVLKLKGALASFAGPPKTQTARPHPRPSAFVWGKLTTN